MEKTLSIAEALKEGARAHQKGNLERASRFYKAIIQAVPNHADAHFNLGLVAIAHNQTKEAIANIKNAISANPKVEQFWMAYIDMLIKTTQFAEARRAIEEASLHDISQEKLNALEKQRSSLKENALHQKTPPPGQRLIEINDCIQEKKLEEAQTLASELTLDFPEHLFGWKVLGLLFILGGEYDKSYEASQKATDLAPSDPEVLNNLGVALHNLGKFDEADSAYRRALQQNSDYPDGLRNLAVNLRRQGNLEEAISRFERAIELEPNDAKTLTDLGFAKIAYGNMSDAESPFRQAIEISNGAAAWRGISKIKTFKERDEDYFAMQSIATSIESTDSERCEVNFGLATACEDMEQYEVAFNYYCQANRIKKSLLKYQSEKDANYYEKLKTNYSLIQAFSEDLKGSTADVTPIFILGMPRSGTTLVEQIISSHSEVKGAGELDYALTFGDSIATGESEISKESLLKFRENYLSHLKPLSGNSPMVTDKTPFNFRYIGLILTAIPEAKIVHVTRDPAAICWGNFKQLFASNQLSYSYDLKDIVKYYSMYKDLMEFWQEHHAESIFNLDYELLTTNQEEQTRQLIRHSGLDWEDVCLAPESNDRAVLTLSNTQVRQKVYRGSSEQWKKYEPFLKGAFDGLK